MSRFSAGVFLSAVAVLAACSDDTLHGTAARVEDYWAGPAQTPVDSQRMPIPGDDVIPIDFGQVEVGSLAQRYLFITNRGNADLIVAAVEVSPSTSDDFTISCLRQGVFQPGCTGSPSDPIVVVPGAELGLGITYTPSGPGPDAGSVHLSLNTQIHAELDITLAGEGVERDIEVCTRDCTGSDSDAPCQGAGYRCNDESGKENLVVDFGESPVGTEYRRHVRVRNLGQLDIVVIELTLDALSSPAFSIDTNTSGLPGVLAPGSEDGFDVVYRPGDGQQHLGRVLVASNDPNEPEVVIELAGQGLAPRVCPEPVSIDFGTVVVGQQEIRSFTLHNCGLMPLEIHRVELAQSPFSPDFSLVDPQSVAGTVPVGGSVEVQVAYSPAENGSDAGGVDIYTNDLASDPQTGKSGTVSLFGRGQSLVCDLKPDPQAVVFGPVEIGSASQIELTLTNQGNGPCELDHVEILQNAQAGEFSLPSAPSQVTIDPGQSESVTVSYGPTDYGPDTGLLGIFANDKDGNEIHVDLNGFGTWPGGQGPVAVCSVNPPNALPLSTVRWLGDQSYDTNNRPIVEYRWTLVAKPAGSATILLGTGANRTSRVDLAGDYTARLVVVNDIGQTSQPCEATTTVVPTQDLWIEMYWQHTGDDMDLHLLAPGGTPRTFTDCYFANCIGYFTPDWGQTGYDGDNPHLDMDDIPGTGPENINIADPADGLYTVFVHDYPESVYTGANHVWVNVYIDGNLVASFENDLTGEDTDWYVCTIDWPSGTVTPL